MKKLRTPELFSSCGRTARCKSASGTCPAGIRLEPVPGHILVKVASFIFFSAAAPALIVPGKLLGGPLNPVAENLPDD
jgi:hypothetical protein